jgi:hypothetical protein
LPDALPHSAGPDLNGAGGIRLMHTFALHTRRLGFVINRLADVDQAVLPQSADDDVRNAQPIQEEFGLTLSLVRERPSADQLRQ